MKRIGLAVMALSIVVIEPRTSSLAQEVPKLPPAVAKSYEEASYAKSLEAATSGAPARHHVFTSSQRCDRPESEGRRQ